MDDRRVTDISVSVERRKRGRPKLDQPMERVDLRLPPDVHDELCRDALRREIPASTLARRILVAFFVGKKKLSTSPP